MKEECKHEYALRDRGLIMLDGGQIWEILICVECDKPFRRFIDFFSKIEKHD